MAKKDFKKEEQNLENVQEALNTTSAYLFLFVVASLREKRISVRDVQNHKNR